MRNLLLLFLIVGYFTVNAQDYKVNWSESQKKNSMLTDFNMIGLEGDYYYFIQTQKGKTTITKRDKLHKKISDQEFIIKKGQKDSKFTQVINTKSGRYLLFQNFLKKKGTELLVSEFKDGQASEPKKIHDLSPKAYISFSKLRGNVAKLPIQYDRYDEVVISMKKNRVGFLKPLSNDSKNEEMEFVVVDDKMQKIWSKEQKFNYKDEALFFTQSTIDSQGNIYLLARMTKKAKNRKEVEGHYKMFIVSKDAFKEFDLELQEGFVPKEITLHTSTENPLGFVVTGFYGKDEETYHGTLYIEGNQNGISNVILNDFPKTSKLIKNDEMKNLNIIKNIEFNDGTIGFVAERYDGLAVSDLIGSNLKAKDLILVRFSKKGEILTFKSIMKYMREDYTTALITLVHLENDNIYLVFNNIINKEQPRKKNGKVNVQRRQSTDLVILSKEGVEILNKELFTSSDKDMTMLAYLSNINSNELLLGCWDVNRFAFGLVKF